MLRGVNIGVAFVGAMLGAGALGQPAGIALVPGLSAPAGAAQMPPLPAEAMAAYTVVNGWVRGMAVGEAPGMVPATAASITLRAGGEVVGRGVAVSRRPEGDAGVVGEAARAAVTEARGRLPVAHDALIDESLRAAAGEVTISLELAGVMVPFSPRDWAAAAMDVAPGIEGVGVRVGERLEVMFPERMLTTGTEAGAALAAMAAKLVEDPGAALKGPGELSAQHGAVYYRFRVTQIAQTRAGGGPVFLERCGTFVPMRELDSRSLERWAAGLAENLWGRRWPGPERYGVRGVYDPVRGEYAERAAAPAEQALVMEALLRYAGLVRGDAALAGEVRRRVLLLADDLAAVEPGEAAATGDPGAAAIAWAVLEELGSGEPGLSEPARALRDACRDAADSGWARFDSLPLATRLLMLRFAPETATATRESRAARAREVLLKLGPAQLPAGMPWLGEVGPGEPAALAGAWSGLRELVNANTLRPEMVPPDQRDLSGGVLLGAGLPSWQSARPLAFLAEMLGDPRFTDPAAISGPLTRQVEGLRFLRQLSADEGETRMYRDPAGARWGVRNSLWDQRMPPEATALTLIAACETLESIARMSGARAAGPAETPR